MVCQGAKWPCAGRLPAGRAGGSLVGNIIPAAHTPAGGNRILLEFIGDEDGAGAPRLAETRPEGQLLSSLWEQFVTALGTLARHGLAHGDLSPYNLLVHHGRLVIIDLPQVVDVIAHPTGRDYLTRDARNVAGWFAARGLPAADPDELAGWVTVQAGLTLTR